MDQITSVGQDVANTGNALMTMLPMILGTSIVLFIFIVVAFLFIRKKSAKNDKTQLKNSLKKTKNKNASLGKNARYQKYYLALARAPIINRYLFKVRMRYELVR